MKVMTWVLVGALAVSAGAVYRKPKREVAARVALIQGWNGGDLERVRVGNQAGVLKVVARDNTTVRFLKGGDSPVGGGIDGREWARLSPEIRDEIVVALELKDPNPMASSLLANYSRISRAHALALLGVFAYPGAQTPALKPELRSKVLQFFRDRLQPTEDNVVRRQAVLALAIQPSTDAQTVASMINLLRREKNAYSTFGCVQFFEYHRDQIQKMSQFQQILSDLALSGSPHTDQIVRGLKTVPVSAPVPTPTTTQSPGPKPAPPAPVPQEN